MIAHLAIAANMLCGIVTVKPGDTLQNIASNHAKTWRYVWQENAFIVNPDLIYPGEKITICDALLPVVSQSPTNASYPQVMHNEPCQSPNMFPDGIMHLWQVPIGCYGGIYDAPRAGYGDCFRWVAFLNTRLPFAHVSARPEIGSAVHIPPNVQGADSSYGHWAYILSIRGRWALISEENMYWRGGGYGKISYRYLLLEPGMLYYS